jgi:hypothetical protein
LPVAVSRPSLNLVSAFAILTVMTIVVTWPQALHLGSQIAAHDDPNFSMWRLGWIAHALWADPRHLFDANIFYPEPRTLAYSDATLLEGVVAAPFLWAGAPLVLVYNVLLLGGIVASGVAMFVLARRLTGSAAAALVSAAVFTMAPYRIEHFMHLELQWTMWIPLAFWAVHRAFDERPLKWGALTGVFIWLQMISCVYYGIFLAMLVAVLVVALAASGPRRARAALPGLALGAAIAVMLTLPYMLPYRANVSTVGSRPTSEVAQYSAAPISYLLAPPQNWLWGGTHDSIGNEGRLFPGLGAVLLGLAAAAYRPRRLVWIYAALWALAVELSFGVNGIVYGWLYAQVNALHGLRAPARFAILAQCALAVLAGFGVLAIQQRARQASARSRALVAGILALLTIEYASSKMFLREVFDNPPDVYTVIRFTGPGVIAELPMPRVDNLPHWDAVYAAWSVNHWHPILNGYSGYYPPSYIQTVRLMQTFPDDESIARLRALNVRFIVVHRSLYDVDDYNAVLQRMRDRPELVSGGDYRDPVGKAQLFEIRR